MNQEKNQTMENLQEKIVESNTEVKKFNFLTDKTTEDELIIDPRMLMMVDYKKEFDTNIKFSVGFIQTLQACLVFIINSRNTINPEAFQMFGSLEILINALTEQAAINNVITPMTKLEFEKLVSEFEKAELLRIEEYNKQKIEEEKAYQAMTYEERLDYKTKLNSN